MCAPPPRAMVVTVHRWNGEPHQSSHHLDPFRRHGHGVVFYNVIHNQLSLKENGVI